MTRPVKAPIPRISLIVEESAAACGVCEGTFNTYIRPHLRPIRTGRKVLFAVSELERWAAEKAETVLPEDMEEAA